MEHYKTHEEIQIELVRERVQKLRRFYIQLFIYGIGVFVYVSKTYWGFPLNFIPFRFLNDFVMWCWTFVMATKGIRILFSEIVLKGSWEQKKINEILEKDVQSRKRWE